MQKPLRICNVKGTRRGTRLQPRQSHNCPHTNAMTDATTNERRDARRKCNSFEKARIAYHAHVRHHADMLCQLSNYQIVCLKNRRGRRAIAVMCFTL